MLALIAACLIPSFDPNGEIDDFVTIPEGKVRVAGHVWQVRYSEAAIRWDSDEHTTFSDNGEQSADVLRDGKEVWKFEEGGYLSFLRMDTPAPFPVFMLKSHSGAGSGESTWLFGIRKGRWVKMARFTDGEIGGPIFRDVDGEGQLEWLVDDNDWYTYYGEPPTRVYAYKLQQNGRLKLWRDLRAHLKKHLPRDPRIRY